MAIHSFHELCTKLATDRGGFTLWLGAGASVAATRGVLPTWGSLARAMGDTAEQGDFPDRLERLSQTIGHHRFRRNLREKLISPVHEATFDQENLLHQAVIGARAGTLVSFNIEMFAASALCLLKSTETFVPRTFRQRTALAVNPTVVTNSGLIGSPIYFPHGLLLQGNVVLTKSEYDRHLGSVAITTAVHLCIGADLVILGMSLADAYLREAILQNRPWLHDVFWVGDTEEFGYREWARVADVTCLHAEKSELWSCLASSIVENDGNGKLSEWLEARRALLPLFLKDLLEFHSTYPQRLAKRARELLEEKSSIEELKMFANFCLDTGHDVPVEIAASSVAPEPSL